VDSTHQKKKYYHLVRPSRFRHFTFHTPPRPCLRHRTAHRNFSRAGSLPPASPSLGSRGPPLRPKRKVGRREMADGDMPGRAGSRGSNWVSQAVYLDTTSVLLHRIGNILALPSSSGSVWPCGAQSCVGGPVISTFDVRAAATAQAHLVHHGLENF
jgi:hypothetical protein